MKRRTAAALTEFDIIASSFPWTRDARGVGDDAAVVGRRGLLCCDALAEGVHFRRDWSSMADVGWKAVSQNVADILAMGGEPTRAVWSVGLGKDWTARDFADLAKGALEACGTYGCVLVGGDTVRTAGPGFVSLSLEGMLRGRPWLRSGARVGDRLVLAGTLGLSAAGLALLTRGIPPGSPKETLRSHRRPHPPTDLARSLRSLGRDVHGCIDISDGLSSECHHMAKASGVAIVIDHDLLPRSRSLLKSARLLGCTPEDWLLHGGEEHSLLLAVAPAKPLPEGCRVIGRVVRGAGVFLAREDRLETLASGGWVHT